MHRDIPDSLTITRERRAFEGQSPAVISSIRRRGVLLVLVVLPDGSRSLIPANWTDWNDEQARRTPADDAGSAHDLGRLGDLLHLRKIIDALYDRPVESVQCIRHMVPNVLAPFLIILTAFVGQAILAEASLSYLGLGVQEPTAAWGLMLQGGAEGYASTAPWIAVFPGLAIALTVFGFSLFGDALRDALDPKLRDH